MLTTTSIDEINLRRLLISCEKKLKEQSIELWTASEKRKYAAYVNHLTELEQSLKHKQHSTAYANRIQQLVESVSQHTMQVDVEKGIIEARLAKKRHMEKLKQFENVDPDWLIELKKQEEEVASGKSERQKDLLAMDDSEAQVYTQTDEEAVEEETDRANKDSCERKDEVPQKESSTSMAGLRQRKSSVSRENETTNIEHVLQHHRQLHDELTTDLGRMAKQLKLNSQAFGDILSKDDYVLQEATKTVENNLEKMTLERQRLDKHYSKSWGTSFMSLFVVLFVVIMFVLVYFTIRYLPKP